MNWPFVLRGALLGFLWAVWQFGSSIYVLDNMPTNWQLLKIASASMVAFCGGIGTYVLDPEAAWKKISGGTIVRMLLLCALLMALSACSGLGILQNPATDTSQQAAIMQQQNARDCVYFKANAAPWAQVTTIIVGTWGQNPPSYAECWQGLPAGIP